MIKNIKQKYNLKNNTDLKYYHSINSQKMQITTLLFLTKLKK